MVDTIPIAYMQQYQSNVRVLCQQEGSFLRNAVDVRSMQGKYSYVERLGSTVAVERTARRQKIEPQDQLHSKRRVRPSIWEASTVLVEDDNHRMIIDPRSNYVMNIAHALGRKIDEILIDAALGNSVSVDADESGSNIGVANTIDEDFGTGSDSDITVEKLIEARRILATNNCWDKDLYCVIDPTANAALLNETKVGSSDYNRGQVLVTGQMQPYMGFKFIELGDLLPAAVSNIKTMFAFARSGLVLGVYEDIMSREGILVDEGFSRLLYGKMIMGATRIEEEKVVPIEAYR